jgi:hypothetical protein
MLCGRGSLKVALKMLNRKLVTMLYYVRLSYKSSIPTCCANTVSLSVNSPCFGLTYWTIGEAEHVRELIDNEKV